MPLHLGVTEAGMPPEGIIKTRRALEQLIPLGIGDTIRVSLTVPNSRKQRRNRRRAGRFSRRHRGRPGPLGVDPWPADAEHHQLPQLFASGERSLYRAGPAVKEMTRYAQDHA